MIGTLWKSNFDYICFKKGDLLVATGYFECESIGKTFIIFTSLQGMKSTWREEWMGNKFQRLEIK
jgi:hypothetical protein